LSLRHPICSLVNELPPDRVVDYAWDEQHVRRYFYFAEKVEFETLGRLTHSANMALAIAVTEWIGAWLSPFSFDKTLGDYIEAGWAALLDRDNTEYFRIVDNDWRGPVLGPTAIALGIINEIFFESYDEQRMAFRSCYALNLARHVMRKNGVVEVSFQCWVEGVKARLDQFHSWPVDGTPPPSILDPEFPKGRLVPREAFDLDRPYYPEMGPALLQELTRQIPPQNLFFHKS